VLEHGQSRQFIPSFAQQYIRAHSIRRVGLRRALLSRNYLLSSASAGLADPSVNIAQSLSLLPRAFDEIPASKRIVILAQRCNECLPKVIR
jgi:hypothetical protein